MGWIINGKEVSNEEHAEYVKQREAEKQRAQEEIQRRINEVGEAYRACTEFIEQHPEVHYEMKNAQMREHDLYRKLRQNLERAGTAPRCEKVREDGTVCGCPQMKGYRYCYAHERMLEMRSGRLELPALEDANAVQMAIMRVQKALIDDEISEREGRAVVVFTADGIEQSQTHDVYRQQKGSGEGDAGSSSQHLPLLTLMTLSAKALPRINADKRGSKPAVSTQHVSIQPEEIAKIAAIARIGIESKTKTFTTEAAEEHRGKGKPQPRAAVPHEHRVG